MTTATQAATERDEMLRLIRAAREIIRHADVRTGYCCCGGSVAGHIPYNDGHSPVDEGEYARQGWEDAVRKLFNEEPRV